MNTAGEVGEIFNHVRIDDRLATSGQPLKKEFAAIAAAGFEAVVNLAMHDSDDAVPAEGSLVAALGLDYFHLPVPFEAPSIERLALFLRVMEALRGRKVWVHCALNYRVSAFVYQYLRTAENWPREKARSAVFGHWRPDGKWQAIFDLEPDVIAAARNGGIVEFWVLGFK